MVARATVPRRASKKQSSKEPFSFVLFLIGLFKLFKATLLIAIGIGAIKFLHKDLASTVLHWAQVLRVDPDNRYLHGTMVKIFRVTPKQLKAISAGTFIYAGLFLTEGLGLLLRKHWAEYFTIITTGSVHPARDLRARAAFYGNQAGGDSDQRPDCLVPGGARPVALKKIFQVVSIPRRRRSTI